MLQRPTSDLFHILAVTILRNVKYQCKIIFDTFFINSNGDELFSDAFDKSRSSVDSKRT